MRKLALSIVVLLCCTSAGLAVADAHEPAEVPSAAEARERAEAARLAAEQAEAQVQAAREALDQATREAEEAAAREEAIAADPVQRALEAAERAEQRAGEAQRDAEEARRAALRLDARLRAIELERAYDRAGASLGGGIFYAPESFDFGIGKSNSEGVSWRAAYRFNPYIALGSRFDLLDEFKAAGSAASGSVRPWAVTGNVRIYLPTGRVQPYMSLGLGAVSARVEGVRFVDGSLFSVRYTEFAFRGGAGLDLYVSPSVVINLDAAYFSPTGKLAEYPFGAVGGAIEYRF